MDDGLVVLLVFSGIVVGAVLFAKALRQENAARDTAGGWHLLSFGYATKTGWIMGIAMAIAAWFLWSNIAWERLGK